ncbi:MAG TPA: hypothetical protein VFZ70_09440 [Euzebyales bacterium]
MNPELIPMLLLSLLLMASDGADAGTARLVLSGEHRLDDTEETVIVGDAMVTIPDDTTLTAPVYVIGGTTRITGSVHARVTQLAGILLVDGDAEIDRLHVIAGIRRIAPTADIARRTGVDLATRTRDPLAIVVPPVLAAGALALVGARLARTRRRNLDNIAGALSDHPVVTLTVGLLLVLTALSLFVFMAFTLVLIPVSVLGLTAGIAVTALGIIGWGHGVGRRLPLQQPRAATAVGAAAVTISLQLVGAVPLVGDVVVGFVVLSGLGAVAITYVGFTAFQPAPLP